MHDPAGKTIGAWPEPRQVTAAEKSWRTPALRVAPLQYYRLRFRAQAPADTQWAAVFFDEHGAELVADHYDQVFAAANWRAHEVRFRAHLLAAELKIHYLPPPARTLGLRDIAVEAIDRTAVGRWADEIAAANPPLRFTPAKDRWRFLPQTIRKLQRGETLRLVVLGDSIANDTANSPVDVLIERAYPGSRVEVVNAVRGATGCPHYQQAGRVQEYVLRFRPDLLVIAGISHQYDVDSIRSVIAQVRRGSVAEILVMTGAVAPAQTSQADFIQKSGLPPAAARAAIRTFPDRLGAMAAAQQAEFLDLRPLWDRYVAESGQPVEWFLRDPIHANLRARQVLARLLAAYFSP